MNGDKLARITGYFAVLAVSVVAALLSYWHAVTVVGEHGERGVYGHLYPATIDGLIVAASMVLLDAARHHVKAHALAWWLVGGGIAATLAANVLDGIANGLLGSIIAAWPAAAFVGAYEMLMVLVRADAGRAEDASPEPVPPELEDVEPEPKPMPRLERTLAATPPWDEPAWKVPPPTQPTFTPVTETGAQPALGTVSVRNPLSRLDRKIPVDERVRQTGSFQAIPD